MGAVFVKAIIQLGICLGISSNPLPMKHGLELMLERGGISLQSLWGIINYLILLII